MKTKGTGPNPILESLIQSRLDDAEHYVDKQEFVKKEYKKFIEQLSEIKKLISFEELDLIECASNALVAESIRAGYRLGVAEGISFMQEIKSVCGVVEVINEPS